MATLKSLVAKGNALFGQPIFHFSSPGRVTTKSFGSESRPDVRYYSIDHPITEESASGSDENEQG